MLYNPKWDKTLAGFILWLEEQPAGGSYDWWDRRVCACGQYAKAIGVERWWEERWRDAMPKLPGADGLMRLPFWDRANELARGGAGTRAMESERRLDLWQAIAAVLGC